MMRKIAYLLACVVFLSCTSDKTKDQKSISNQPAVKKDTVQIVNQDAEPKVPKSVAEIKSVYANMVKAIAENELDTTVIHYDCAAEISGTVTYFSKNGKLRLVKHEYNEYDHYSATDQYFVVDEQLCFVYLNSLVWSFESNAAVEGATKDDITEERIYIVDNQPVECLEKKFSIKSADKIKPVSANVPNKKVACKPLSPVLKDFKSLIAFRNQGDDKCGPQ